MATDYGEFDKPAFVGVGDPYVEHREKPLHHIKGKKQFLTAGPKRGQTSGTLGGTYTAKPLYEGEPYDDGGKRAARERAKAKAKFTNPRGFVPSSPGKRLHGSGTADGAFTAYEHLDDGGFAKPARRRPKDDDDSATKRNIVTSPPKKGGPGFPGRGLASEPEYVPEPVDAAEARKKKERADERAKLGDRKPFVAMVASRGAPLDSGSALGVSGVYQKDEKCIPLPSDETQGKTKKQLVEERKAKEPEKPFVPSTPGKRGPHATFAPFPERSKEVYDPRGPMLAMRPSRLAPAKDRTKHLPEKLRERPTFKPSSGPKSGVTKSVAHARIFRATIARGGAGGGYRGRR